MALGEEPSTVSALAPGAAGAPTHRRREHAFPWLYRLIRDGCMPVLRSQFRYRVSGLERLPASGPFVLAANHHNYLDGILLGTAVPRPISFLVMPRVYRASPLHPFFHRRIGSHPRQLGASRPRRHQARVAGARRGPHRRHLPGGRVQSRGSSRWRASRCRTDRPPVRRPCRSRGHPRHVRGAPGTAVLRAARAPTVRPVRRRDALRLAPASSRHTRGARRGHPSNHGRDRSAARRGATSARPQRPAERMLRDRASRESPRARPGPGASPRGRTPPRKRSRSSLVLRPAPLAVRHRRERGVGTRAPARGADQRGRAHRDHPGLASVRAEIESGRFPFRRELEDIHMNVERRLIELTGPVGGKLHTGRSRNDQIALDERLYLRDIIRHVDARHQRACRPPSSAAPRSTSTTPMPGYTHLQRAQPVLLAHHLLAYVFMLARDRERFRDCRARVNVMPLGAAALAGTAFAHRPRGARPRPRLHGAEPEQHGRRRRPRLRRSSSSPPPRSSACTSRASPRTSRCGRPRSSASSSSADAFATGSSIMPQKKNPDVAELIRGKTGRLYGNLTAALVTMKGLPLTYNSRHAGGQGAAVRLRRHAGGGARRAPADARRASRGAPIACATPPRPTTRRRPTSPTTSSRRGCRSATRTRSSGKTVRHAMAHGVELGDLALDELRPFSPRDR